MDVCRLALYDGPVDIFDYMNTKRLPFPTLIALSIFDSTEPEAAWGGIRITEEFSPTCLRNIQELSVYSVSFPDDCGMLAELLSLTCFVDCEVDYQRLFDCCTKLARAQDIEFMEIFRSVSLPRSLQLIKLRPARTFDLDVLRLLPNWTVVLIPRLPLHEVGSLNGVLPLSLASHAHPAELSLTADHEIALVSLPDSEVVWSMRPFSMSDSHFLEGLETDSCQRLTSISVAIKQLGRLFVSQLHVTGLEQFEFRLNGVQAWPLLRSDQDFFVRAPRLRRVIFNANGSADAIGAHMEDIYGVLDVLCASFRALLVYDGEILTSITLYAPAACVQQIDCADFAYFAHEYIVRTDAKNQVPS
ncbi:hypothetical protein AURDEDRAFT_170264 [Auricularia subglabra TFB-10046 SS5]|nr:hypothetical protein AURDEDRAFT_170264 [Auricularia subglabra TFB-10046 SS5]